VMVSLWLSVLYVKCFVLRLVDFVSPTFDFCFGVTGVLQVPCEFLGWFVVLVSVGMWMMGGCWWLCCCVRGVGVVFVVHDGCGFVLIRRLLVYLFRSRCWLVG